MSKYSPSNATPPPDNTWFQDWEDEWRRQELQKETRRQQDRTYFGAHLWGASQKHRDAITDIEKLTRFNLPIISSEVDLARWLGVSLGTLRWLTFDENPGIHSHYVRSVIPKRRGGERVILAPKKRLKSAQRQIHREILSLVPVAPVVHGFLPNHSTRTNAEPHVGQEIILKVDLEDFFPSLSYRRIRGVFIMLGYSFAVASNFALLCTGRDPEIPLAEDTSENHKSRFLVQGAPTSPVLANIATWKLDKRLEGLAYSKGFVYTRYADDITFSGPSRNTALRILSVAKRVIEEEGFTINIRKTSLLPRSTRQIVTGIVVNEKTSTLRETRRLIRAIIYNARKTGLTAQNRENRPNFPAYLRGLISYIKSVNEDQAKNLLNELEVVLKQSQDN